MLLKNYVSAPEAATKILQRGAESLDTGLMLRTSKWLISSINLAPTTHPAACPGVRAVQWVHLLVCFNCRWKVTVWFTIVCCCWLLSLQMSDLAFPVPLLMYPLTEVDTIVFEYNPGHSEAEFQDGHVGLLIHSKYVHPILLVVCVQ